MKRKIIFSVIVLVITSIITIQSCKKASPLEPIEVTAALPAAPQPVNETIMPFTGSGQTINLSWEGTSSTATSWDVYFGKSSNPPKVATVTSNAYTATITSGGFYNWKVIGTDANGKTTESPVWSFDVNSNPDVPSGPLPAMSATGVSVFPVLAWVGSDPDGDAVTFDLLLGKTAVPATVLASGLTDTTFSVHLEKKLSANTVYYWQVVAHDPNGGQSVSPVWSFTTGTLDPITAFTGSYTADEPAEAYSYGVGFTKVDAATIKCDNYWNSGWVVNFTLDLVKLTYSFPQIAFGNYSMIESGIIDPASGTMTGTYTIFYKGGAIEQGAHTYTRAY